MNNLAYRTYNIESIKNEFLNIGFSEEAIDFVFFIMIITTLNF